jgi:hypothetical protein
MELKEDVMDAMAKDGSWFLMNILSGMIMENLE